VERSHRSDDEEFYLPFLLEIWNEWNLLKISAGWVYLYNLVRPHYGAGMGEKPPIEKLRELGYDLPDEFALFPPVLLDTIITDWAVKGGNC
jgi:hypothetical protein